MTGAEIHAQLDEALRLESSDPHAAQGLYARVERANRLRTWWLVVLATATIAAEALYLHSKPLTDEDRVAIGLLGGLVGMTVPVYVCLWREHLIVNGGVNPVGLVGQALGLSLMYLLLETLTILAYVFAAVLLVGLPLHLAVAAALDVFAEFQWFPPPAEMPWAYSAEIVVGGLVGLWLVLGGHTAAVGRFLFDPLRYAAALAVAVRDTPWELIVFAVFTAGTFVLAGSGAEAPYATFAVALPAALVVFRDGLTGRDLTVSYLARLGKARTSLWLAGRRGGNWHRGRAIWLLDRLQTELDRESTVARELDSHRRDLVVGLYDPLFVAAVWDGAADAPESDAVDGPAWTMSATNTQLLLRHLASYGSG